MSASREKKIKPYIYTCIIIFFVLIPVCFSKYLASCYLTGLRKKTIRLITLQEYVHNNKSSLTFKVVCAGYFLIS